MAVAAVFAATTIFTQAQGNGAWQPLGPTAVESQSYGLVTGRITALALDPSDATGNTLYAGSTGGGVWRSQNVDTSGLANISFLPLTDEPAPLCNPAFVSGAALASISIGALTVQPGGTGVILAGTGDPNDAADSYYGAGILRSANGGATWCLIPSTADLAYNFAGEGFAGFAWSTVNQQRVVAAVSQAWEGTLVNVVQPGRSYEGLYYSSDSGATWSLATITDGAGEDVQGPSDNLTLPDGNAATSVVWNPVRQLFVAAVRYHGYYQSADGITWTRLAAQPGAGLAASAGLCPSNGGKPGSPACPIFRGSLAVNPQTGDTFAWTVDLDNQDQGIWQDVCAASAGACTNLTMAFGQQWSTAALETNTWLGPATIANGDYNLTLAAVPSGQETMLLAGANDLWKSMCPLAQGCTWRNTTNSTTCMSAQVGEYQHALAWNGSTSNPLEILVGNDSGLWRSTDAIGETGAACSASDASHFQNLNGSLGSLAEVRSISQVGNTPYTMMAGLGVNGTAGVNSGAGPTADWPEILGGEGGPVAIDPVTAMNWYVNNGAGVSIYRGTPPSGSTLGGFSPVINYTTDGGADVVKDGLTMTGPAPFLVDPLANSQLLIGTCRVWRGPASGVGWSDANAISPMLDGSGDTNCSGDALIRSMAAQPLAISPALPSGGEVVYVGMYGSANGGANLPGHVLSAVFNTASGTTGTWTDLTLNPVTNDTNALNYYGLDISSIFIDPHDPTGNTVYITVAGIPSVLDAVQPAYRSTDGGAHWIALTANLPAAAANSLVVDPQDANTVYVATDAGVFSTRQIANCANASSGCWSAFGSGLPESPVIQVSAAPASAAVHDLVAATYGRGIWITPLWTAAEDMTTATATPASLTFASQVYGSSSSAQTVTVKNTGGLAMTTASIAASGDFSETDNCQNTSVAAGGSCAIQVTFTPTQAGIRTGLLTINTNVTGGQLTVALSGTGTPSGALSLSPAAINFGGWEVGTTATAVQVTASNSGSPAVAFTNSVSGAFSLASNSCGSSVPAQNSCNLTVAFSPVQAGAATGTLTFTDVEGTQSVALSGSGLAPPTDGLTPTSLSFTGTVIGQLSAAQTVTLTNSGGVPLTSIAISASGPFQQTNSCGSVLGANAPPCVITVQFVPTAAGPQSGTLTVTDITRTQPETVTLSGTGLTPPAIGVTPASLAFAVQTVGQASAPQTLTVKNTGGAPLAGVGFAITPSTGSGFSCSPNTCSATTCPTLAAGASCTVQVVFTPTAAGGANAQLVVSDSSGVAPVTVQLSGMGQNPAGLNVNPAQLVFPIVSPGQSSPAQTVTLTNTGGSTATALTLTATPPFSLVQNTCPASLTAGASCSTGVIFAPSLNGPYTGTLTIASPSLGASASVPLSGTVGVPGTVQALPTLIDFSQTGVGLLSSPVTVTLTNPIGATSLTNLSLAATAGFRLVNNACASTLAAGASCTVGVEFAPASAGPQSGSLTVSSTALPTGDFVPLSGMGFDFAVEPSGVPNQTIANGQTADYKLLITPLLGSQGVFTLQCGTLPPNTACTFNPASEGIPANTVGNELVEIATGLTQVSARNARPVAWPALPLACGLALMPLALRRRRKALTLVALLAMLAAGVSSCTQSSVGVSLPGPRTGPGISPAGTYSIPVTVSSNGVTHAITLTLTVD
ncbi:MAG: choice-of-anchor D domain-containing protein [Terracidiphilus sp.]